MEDADLTMRLHVQGSHLRPGKVLLRFALLGLNFQRLLSNAWLASRPFLILILIFLIL
jgi:hypothetical protein